MGINLDRFSQVMPWENKTRFTDGDCEYEIEQVVICKGCQKEIDPEDKYIPSDLWEDDYIHDDPICLLKYCEKEKDSFAENKRILKDKKTNGIRLFL